VLDVVAADRRDAVGLLYALGVRLDDLRDDARAQVEGREVHVVAQGRDLAFNRGAVALVEPLPYAVVSLGLAAYPMWSRWWWLDIT